MNRNVIFDDVKVKVEKPYDSPEAAQEDLEKVKKSFHKFMKREKITPATDRFHKGQYMMGGNTYSFVEPYIGERRFGRFDKFVISI